MKRRNIENSSRETYHTHLRAQRDIKKTIKTHSRKDVEIDVDLRDPYKKIIDSNNKEVKKLEEDLPRLKQNKEELENNINRKHEKTEILNKAEKELENLVVQKKNSYNSQRENYDVQKIELIRFNEEYHNLVKKYASVRTKIDRLDSNIANKEEKSKTLILQLEDINNKSKELENQLEIIDNQIKINKKGINIIKGEIETYEKDILTKRLEKKKFLEGLSRYQVKTPQEMIAEERHRTQLQKELKVVEKTILANEEWLSHLKERNKSFLRIKEDLNDKKEKLTILNGLLKPKLKQIDKKLKDEKDYFFEKYSKFERIENEVGSYGFLQRSIFNAFNGIEFEEYKDLKSDRRYLIDFRMTLSELIKHYNYELNDKSNTIVESAIKTIEHEIQITENCIKSHQEKKKEILTRERSLMKDDELAHFKAQLEGIKKYVKNKQVKELQKNLDYLENYHKELKDSEAEIEKIEEANWVAKQNIARCQFEYNLSLEEKKAIIQNYQVDSDKSFQTDENADLYQGQTLESMQKNLDRITDSIHDLENKYHKSNKKVALLKKMF